MRLYRTLTGPVAEEEGAFYAVAAEAWDRLVDRDDLLAHLRRLVRGAAPLPAGRASVEDGLLPPLGSQEVWAAGVTYFRSREARMEESHDAGGGDFYSRVYDAERPELFFKASPHRVVGSGSPVRIRRDSRWNVPEPELAVFATSNGSIVGYTIGNDVSSRSIEGENPLYLPQAKVYDGSCALGPALLVRDGPLAPETAVSIVVVRGGGAVFEGRTSLSRMRRSPQDLVAWLRRECTFPTGCVLLTGTGIVPDGDFTLAARDEVRIEIDGIGTLVNSVAPG